MNIDLMRSLRDALLSAVNEGAESLLPDMYHRVTCNTLQVINAAVAQEPMPYVHLDNDSLADLYARVVNLVRDIDKVSQEGTHAAVTTTSPGIYVRPVPRYDERTNSWYVGFDLVDREDGVAFVHNACDLIKLETMGRKLADKMGVPYLGVVTE